MILSMNADENDAHLPDNGGNADATAEDSPPRQRTRQGRALLRTACLLPWLFGRSQWWSSAASLIGVVILLGLVVVAIDPPFLMRDGQTDDGMPTGGVKVALPDFGFVLWAIGSLALIAAGICGWIDGQRHRHRAQAWGGAAL